MLKQMLFPSKASPVTLHSLKSSQTLQSSSRQTDKEKAQISYLLATLPRRQIILETGTKERYLLTPKRVDGSLNLRVPDARKVRWAYDIYLILEQEVIVEEVKDEPEGDVLGEVGTVLSIEVTELNDIAPTDSNESTTAVQQVQAEDGEQMQEKEVKTVENAEEREEGEVADGTPAADEIPKVVEPSPAPDNADTDGDIKMDDGDKEPGELNEDEAAKASAPAQQAEASSSTLLSPAALTAPPSLKLDTTNLPPSRPLSRLPSTRNSPVNTIPSINPSPIGNLDIAMEVIDEDGSDERSFVTLIRGEDEDGNEQSVHYPVQMLQRHVTEGMLRFEREGVYVKEASFVGPTVPPSPTTSVAADSEYGERMDGLQAQGPGGEPIEWRMQVVSWKWAGQAWADY